VSTWDSQQWAVPPSTSHAAPPAEALAAMLGPASTIVRQLQIVDSTGAVYADVSGPGLLDGNVTVDQTRTERRAFEVNLDNTDGRYVHAQGQLWYDKIVRLWRGVDYISPSTGLRTQWVTQIGEFMIDEIISQNFPHTVHLQGRDWTKKLLLAQFKYATNFVSGQRLEDLIKTIALNGGITKFILPATGVTTGKDWFFDQGVSRWDAMIQLATNYGYELFFNGNGYLLMRVFQDPSTTPSFFTFQTGQLGSLVSYSKASRDTRLYNSVVAIGESTNTIPIVGIAQNNTSGSPTSIANIGERVFSYKSAFITTQAQANQIAANFLAIHALEEYDLALNHIVLPWLEGGDIVDFIDPAPAPGEPTRFLLSSFNIPLVLGAMASACKRVTKVG